MKTTGVVLGTVLWMAMGDLLNLIYISFLNIRCLKPSKLGLLSGAASPYPAHDIVHATTRL